MLEAVANFSPTFVLTIVFALVFVVCGAVVAFRSADATR
jgi:hypothetical protein